MYGKIKYIDFTTASLKNDLEFRYDPMGNRTMKIEYASTGAKYTFYSRDAQGNIMATYTRKVESNVVEYRNIEQPIYGSDRVGVLNRDVLIYSAPYVSEQPIAEVPVDNGVKENDKKMLLPLWKYLATSATIGGTSLRSLIPLQMTVAAEGRLDMTVSPATFEIPYNYRHGVAVENVAVGTERDGTIQLYCVSSKTGNNAAVVKIYDGDNNPISLNSGILADINSQSTLMRVPGSEKEWFCFTLYQGKPYMSRIDEENGVLDANILLDGQYATYGQTMALVSDYGNGASKLLLRRYNNTLKKTYLVSFTIDRYGAGNAVVLDSLSSTDKLGVGEIQFSPDAGRVAMINTAKSGLIQKTEQILLWQLNDDRSGIESRTDYNQTYYSIATQKKYLSLDFTGSGNFIYFVQSENTKGNRKIMRMQVAGGSGTVQRASIPGAGDVRRGSDGRMYVAADSKYFIVAIPDYNGMFYEQAIDNGYRGRALAAQPIRVYLPQSEINSFARMYGSKQYEIKDHLGNVRTTFSDSKLYDPGADEYSASLSSVNNYYAFGSLQPERYYQSESYRFGFNGQEMDNEISGLTGTHTTAMFWEYDSRLGRRWNTDPVVKEWESPYASFHNNPIFWSDPNGDDPPDKTQTHVIQKGDTYYDLAQNSKGAFTMEDLIKWNPGIDPNKLQIGQSIYTSDPDRWESDGNGYWIDRENPNELWQHIDGEGWVNRNQSFGDWYAEGVKETGETVTRTFSDDSFQALKIVATTITEITLLHYSPTKLPRIKGTSVTPGRYIPPLRLEYEAAVRSLKKYGETMIQNGCSEEVVARTLHQARRNLGIKYKDMTPAHTLTRIYLRNFNKYGDIYGPSIKYLREKGYSWKDIINSASTPGGKDMIFGIHF